MITRVFGKKIKNVYDVNEGKKEIIDKNGIKKFVYTNKPTLKKTIEVEEWIEICSFKGIPRYNSNGYHDRLNISEKEEVIIEEEVFRADLNEVHLKTNKIVEEHDIYKKETEAIYNICIRDFNKTMIKSDYVMKSYCDLHKLEYEDTDCIKLFQLLFPNKEYIIEDGVMKEKEKVYTTITDKIEPLTIHF